MSQTNILLEAGTNELEIVEFHLEESATDPATPNYRGYYGVNVAKVLEIIRMPKVTGLPEVQHPSVLGAFNLRSHIIPLVDLSQWLGKQRTESEPPKVIVTEFNNVTTAFMVSGVNRIHRISWEEVEPPNKYVAALSNNSITGVVKLEGGSSSSLTWRRSLPTSTRNWGCAWTRPWTGRPTPATAPSSPTIRA